MPLTLGDRKYDPSYDGAKDVVTLRAVVDVGGTGAPTIRSSGPIGLTVTRTGVGAYTVGAPAVPSAGLGYVKVFVTKSTTIFHVQLLTESPTTGAFTFELRNNAATPVATEAASGDVFVVEFCGTRGKAQL